MASGGVWRITVPLMPAASKSKASTTPEDEPAKEVIFVDPEMGPMAYHPGTRMKAFRTIVPSRQAHYQAMGPARIEAVDRCGGRASHAFHVWGNKTSTQRKVDLLTVAKKNKLLRDLHGDDFCVRQDCDYLVRNLKLTKVVQTGAYKIGDTADFEIPEGEAAGTRILCRVSGAGKEPGTYSIKVPAQPPVIEAPMEFDTIPDYMLHRLKVTIWRCSYKLGMDIHESPESEGPIKNNVLRNRPSLNMGDVVRVAQEQMGEDGITYLRLEDGRGWVYDTKPGVGTACVRDEGAADIAVGIDVAVPDEGDKVTDIDVLAARLGRAEPPAMVPILQKVLPDRRAWMMGTLPIEKHAALLQHLLADVRTMEFEEYLMKKEFYKVHEVVAKHAGDGFGAGGG